VNEVVVKIDELVVWDQWLGSTTNRASELQGNDSFDSATPITVIATKDGLVDSGQELELSVVVYTHVDWGGEHPPEVSSYFGAIADAEQKVLLASRKL
jgi:hypothetical protein